MLVNWTPLANRDKGLFTRKHIHYFGVAYIIPDFFLPADMVELTLCLMFLVLIRPFLNKVSVSWNLPSLTYKPVFQPYAVCSEMGSNLVYIFASTLRLAERLVFVYSTAAYID